MINWPNSEYWRKTLSDVRGESQIIIKQVCSASNPKDNGLLFVNSMTETCCASLMKCKGCLIIANRVDAEACKNLEHYHGVIYVENPRYEFAKILRPLWDTRSLRGTLTFDRERSIYLGSNVSIDPKAIIEPGVIISKDCMIGAGAYIMTGARLGPNVHIGENTVIRENAVLGGWGFGFARAEGKATIRIPHIGGVRIGRDVEIGALTTVCSGTIDPTIIEGGCMINDHAHIAHNCHLHANIVVGACADISGSVHIGSGTWLAPNCSVIDRISIGENVVIGIGAVVVRSVQDNLTIVGNPGRELCKAK